MNPSLIIGFTNLPLAMTFVKASKLIQMKKLFASFLFTLFFTYSSFAQLPAGAVAPDFMVTDVNGVSHHLYDILDQGKPVVVDFSATWCGICWNYHNTHILDNLNSTYGPSGTNAIEVLFLEADLSTNLNCLYGTSGCIGNSQGNWVASSNYPVVSLTNNLVQISYDLNSYPTLYGISPDRKAYEIGTASQAVWESWLLQSFKMNLTANVTQVGCQSLGAIDLTVAQGYGNKTYIWSNGASTQDISGLSAGDYSVTVTDGHGYAKTKTFTVAATGLPQVAAAPSGNIDCSTAQVTLLGTGSATGQNITYLWTTANGNIVSGANSINATANATGTYTLKVTDTTTGCTAIAETQITQVNNGPIANAGNPQTLNCISPQATLAGSGSNGANLTYSWTTNVGNIVSGANTLNPVVNAGGTYYLAVTNTANGCSSVASVLVSADLSHPAISVQNGSLTCSNPTTQICATVAQGVNVTWAVNGINVNTNCVNVTQAGTYQATATSSNGCSSTAVSTVAAPPNLPQISIAPPATLTCNVTSTTIIGQLSGIPSEHIILWTTSNGNIVSGASTLTPTVNKAGLYKMTATHIASNCQSSSEVTVTEFINTPVAAFASNLVNGQLTLIGLNPNGNVSWALGNGNVGGGSSITVTYPTSGTYNICMTVTNECAQVTTCNPIAYINPISLTGTITQPICHGDKGSIIANPQGSPITSPVTYAWTGPNGFTANTNQVNGLAAGNYKCTIVDAANLSAIASFDIVEPSIIIANPTITNASTGQANGSVSLSITGGSGLYNISWSNGASGIQITNLNPGSYSATVKDTYGCEKTFGPFTVQLANGINDLADEPVISIYPNPANQVVQYSFDKELNGNTTLQMVNPCNITVWQKAKSEIAKNGSIDTSTFPDGVYFLMAKSNDRFIVKKVVVQH